MEGVDLLIAGAGPVGCVVAEHAARLLDWNVLIVERRPHVAGNCHDSRLRGGHLIQNYGPHYFRTNSQGLIDYLSRFTEWIPGVYVVKSQVNGRLFDFPINLNTLEGFFGRELTPESAAALLATARLPMESPADSEEMVLSRVGRELYEAFYLNYTLKQWGCHPRELLPSVCGRIPVRLDRNDRYVDHRFQLMPRDGFTAMFRQMINHPRIRVWLDSDFRAARRLVKPRVATLYTGPIDEYFGHSLGKLPYRSLRFDFREYAEDWRQPCVQINYPNDGPYTRTVEFKHVTGQRTPGTVVAHETPTASGDPFYPIPRAENMRLYDRYAELAERETRAHRVHFAGRLASYRYMNTDEALFAGIKCFRRIARQARRESAAMAAVAHQ